MLSQWLPAIARMANPQSGIGDFDRGSPSAHPEDTGT